MEDLPAFHRPSRNFMLLAGACIAAVVALYLVGTSAGWMGFTTVAPAPTVAAAPTNFDAWWACRGFVQQNLKAPSTAVFPNSSEARITKLSGPSYRVVAYVDAQNSFGAQLRQPFTCDATWGGGDRWTLSDLKIG